ncbi:MAG TPA: endonuclease/exonuclease/phosphatase family protein [Candidatus Onthovicinus excrementipullorum]|nr:endonuclease/exonuclease/phosphatase family protein [Candidatus Onthovicinus excrementipullorum]
MKAKKTTKIIAATAAAVLAAAIITVPTVFAVRGNIGGQELPKDFTDGMASADAALAPGASTRIMSSNLLVHYASWGGEPAKPRAKMYVSLIEKYRPDVVGLQEVCGSWFACLYHNLPDGYKFIDPLTTGLFVHMTSMIYNANTLTLLDSDQVVYSEGDNSRLRRVVWALFERKDDGKQFVVTSTHFDLIRENQEEEELHTMTVQAEEMIALVNELGDRYNCPVFSTGDFNAKEDGRQNGEYDAPEIYSRLIQSLTDTKAVAREKKAGADYGIEEPTYDHIFLRGNAEIEQFQILSQPYLTPMSDHYSIFIDAAF